MRLILLLLSLASCGLPARILSVLPFAGKSHFIFLSSVLHTLLHQGHHVVEYSPFPPSQPLANYTHVEVHTGFEKFLKKMTYDEFLNIAKTSKDAFGFVHRVSLTLAVCEDALKHENIQKLLNSDEHFDLVMVESTFGQESMLVFGQKFGAPVIAMQVFGTTSTVNMDAGNALSIATIPEAETLAAADNMSFRERLHHSIITVARLLTYYLYAVPKHDQLIRKYYRDDAPPLLDMMNNVSLYLVNSHPAIEYTRPYSPNIIPIAGINITPERSSLPQDLQTFMDEANDGVVYFCLGSVAPVHLMPEDVVQGFVKVFSKLKQRVLWKTETESIPGLSANVKLAKWVPQPGVLAHPNCVLFITHGGLFSQHEALHAGVPVVGIPLFADQPYNVRLSEHRGFGVLLDFDTLSEANIHTAITTVLSDHKYRENAERLSRIFRDRPMSPADSVVFWVEYVLRHAGAHHLRPASTRLSWYQLALLDVLAAIIVPVIIILFAILFILKKVLCSFKRKKSRVLKNKKTD